MTLYISLTIYHKYFQKPHTKPKVPLGLELAFYSIFPSIFVLCILGIIYKIITRSPKHMKAVQESTIINTLSNLTFCIYMVHPAVITTRQYTVVSHYSFYSYEVIANFFCDFGFSVFFALLVALLIELPCSSLWRSYADGAFLGGKEVKKQKEVELSRIKQNKKEVHNPLK